MAYDVSTLDQLTYYLSQPNLPIDFLDSLLSKQHTYQDNYMSHIDPSNVTKAHLEKLHHHGLDQWWRLFDLIRFTYHKVKPTSSGGHKDVIEYVIEYVFKVGQAGIIDRLLSYFGTDDYRDLRQYLITNFRSALSECNHRGELGLIRMTRAALFDLIQADFIICIKNLSDLMLADANYPQFYHFEPKLVEEPTNCCVISDQWKLHCFHVLDVNRIWHSSVLQLVLPLSIMTRSAYPIEYLCCFQEGIQGIIWAKTQCVYKDTLHQIIKNCRCPFSAQQLPAVIILWHEAGYEIDRTIENIRPIDLCLSFGLIESAELLIYLGVNPAGTSAVKYLVHFSKPIQIKILNQMSGKPNYVLHEILKKCSNQMIDEKLMDTIQLLGTYNYPLRKDTRCNPFIYMSKEKLQTKCGGPS